MRGGSQHERGRLPRRCEDRRTGPPAPWAQIDHGVDVGAVGYGAGIGDRAERAMAEYVAEFEVLGPWSLQTSRGFWEGFTPAALAGQLAGPGLRTVFCAEGDWRRAEVGVTQAGDGARLVVTGDGDLEAAAAQARRSAWAANPASPVLVPLTATHGLRAEAAQGFVLPGAARRTRRCGRSLPHPPLWSLLPALCFHQPPGG
jgi:hypothetical protein